MQRPPAALIARRKSAAARCPPGSSSQWMTEPEGALANHEAKLSERIEPVPKVPNAGPS